MRRPVVHRLKTWIEVYRAIEQGLKSHEYRRNDRDFEFGDILELEEWNQEIGVYTGSKIRAVVSYINKGPDFGIPEGFAVMSIKVLSIEAGE